MAVAKVFEHTDGTTFSHYSDEDTVGNRFNQAPEFKVSDTARFAQWHEARVVAFGEGIRNRVNSVLTVVPESVVVPITDKVAEVVKPLAPTTKILGF